MASDCSEVAALIEEDSPSGSFTALARFSVPDLSPVGDGWPLRLPDDFEARGGLHYLRDLASPRIFVAQAPHWRAPGCKLLTVEVESRAVKVQSSEFLLVRRVPVPPAWAGRNPVFLALAQVHGELRHSQVVEARADGSLHALAPGTDRWPVPDSSAAHVRVHSCYDPFVFATAGFERRTHDISFVMCGRTIATVPFKDVIGAHRHPTRPDLFFLHGNDLPGGAFLTLGFDSVDAGTAEQERVVLDKWRAVAAAKAAAEAEALARNASAMSDSTGGASGGEAKEEAKPATAWTRYALRLAPDWVVETWMGKKDEENKRRANRPADESKNKLQNEVDLAQLAQLARLGPRCLAAPGELNTLLHEAVRRGASDAVGALLESSAADYPTCLLTPNQEGKTPLDMAIERKDVRAPASIFIAFRV
jgi:hypothetical protein